MDRPVSRHVSLFRRESYGRTLGVAESDGQKPVISLSERAARWSIMNSPANHITDNHTNEPFPNQFFPTDLFPNQLNPPITVYFARASPLETEELSVEIRWAAVLRLREAATASS